MTGEDEAQRRREERRKELRELEARDHQVLPRISEVRIWMSYFPWRKLLRDGLVGTVVLGTVVFLLVVINGENWLGAAWLALVSGPVAFLVVFLSWFLFLFGGYRGYSGGYYSGYFYSGPVSGGDSGDGGDSGGRFDGGGGGGGIRGG